MSESTIPAAPDDAELVAAAEQAEQDAARSPAELVGFVGCPKRGGVLKARVSRKVGTMTVLCPRCRETHFTSKPMVREVLAGELVALIADETPMQIGDTPPATDPGSGRRQVSNSAIRAAIPVDRDVPAGEVATELGFAGTDALTKRLKRTNERAEDRNEPAPYVLTVSTGKATLVRRAA